MENKRKVRETGVSKRTLRRRKAHRNDSDCQPLLSSDSDNEDNFLNHSFSLFSYDAPNSSSPSIVDTMSSPQAPNSVVVDVPVSVAVGEGQSHSEIQIGGARRWCNFLDSGELSYECDSCLSCSCIVCKVCKHNQNNECIHCEVCVAYSKVGHPLCSSSESEDEVVSSEELQHRKIREEFKEIVLTRQIKQNAVDDLLHLFRRWGFGNFPKSAKTLLDTPVDTPVRIVPPGGYWHRGIRSDLQQFVKESGCSAVEISMNVDGVPITSSSNSAFWPILCCFNRSDEVILAGAYYGQSKPDDCNIFLEEFLNEIFPLCKDGLTVHGKKIPIFLHCLTCDAPAKALILLIKNFNGYFSCPKCCQEGEMNGRRMCFPEIDCALRTDESFKLQTQKEHHVGKATIQDVPNFGPVSNVPYDYMHLVLLGVMRKIMYLQLQGPLSVRLKGQLSASLSDSIVSAASWKPKELARKLRPLQFIKRYKATEFRQILFYTGIVVFEGVLRKDLYEHFLVLHVAMTILAHTDLCKTDLSYADSLLKFWVKTFKCLYGSAYVSYNVHGLTHLASDVEKFGPVDQFSAFKFENYLQFLVKLIRKGEKPLQQLARRYAELSSVSKRDSCSNPSGFSKTHVDGPVPDDCGNPQYRRYRLARGVTFDIAEPDNCCLMSDGSVVLVKNFVFCNVTRRMVAVGRRFLQLKDIYAYPLPSSCLGSYFVSNLSHVVQKWPVESIEKKFYRMPFRDGFAVVPLIHSHSEMKD